MLWSSTSTPLESSSTHSLEPPPQTQQSLKGLKSLSARIRSLQSAMLLGSSYHSQPQPVPPVQSLEVSSAPAVPVLKQVSIPFLSNHELASIFVNSSTATVGSTSSQLAVVQPSSPSSFAHAQELSLEWVAAELSSQSYTVRVIVADTFVSG